MLASLLIWAQRTIVPVVALPPERKGKRLNLGAQPRFPQLRPLRVRLRMRIAAATGHAPIH